LVTKMSAVWIGGSRFAAPVTGAGILAMLAAAVAHFLY